MKVFACSFLILFAISAFAQTHQFSADMVDTDKQGGTNQTKMYVGAGKMRVDGKAGQPTTIVDYGSSTVCVVMQKEKMYMQMNMQDSKGQLPQSFSLLAPTDPNDPCAPMKKVVTDLTCKKVGTETLNDRSVDKWEANRGHGEKGFLWFDPKLQFVVKVDNPEHIIEIRNIQEGSQPATLFSVPSDYRKMN